MNILAGNEPNIFIFVRKLAMGCGLRVAGCRVRTDTTKHNIKHVT